MFNRYRTQLCTTADPPASGAPPAPPSSTPPAPSTSPAAPPPGEEWKGMTQEQFNQRLAKEREQGTKSFLKSMGFENVDQAKSFLDESKKLMDSQKTEAQRAAERLASLEPKAKQAETYETTIKKYLELEEKAIPESKRGLLALAPPTEQAAARLEWIALAKMQGLFAESAPAAATATTTPAAQALPPADKPGSTIAPSGPTPPKPASEQSAFEKWSAMKASGKDILAADFYRRNATAIEATRPK
jgi:hypothetical protein